MKDISKILFSLYIFTLTMLTVWIAIVLTINPTQTDPLTRAAFFGSFFLWSSGIISLLIIYIASMIKNVSQLSIIKESFFHGSLFSGVITLLLILRTLNVLGLLEFGVVILLLILSELYLRAKKMVNHV